MASPAYFFLLAFPIVQYVSHQRNLSETKGRHHMLTPFFPSIARMRVLGIATESICRVEMLFMQVLQNDR